MLLLILSHPNFITIYDKKWLEVYNINNYIKKYKIYNLYSPSIYSFKFTSFI